MQSVATQSARATRKSKSGSRKRSASVAQPLVTPPPAQRAALAGRLDPPVTVEELENMFGGAPAPVCQSAGATSSPPVPDVSATNDDNAAAQDDAEAGGSDNGGDQGVDDQEVDE